VAAGAIVGDRGWLGKLRGELEALLAPVFLPARSRLTAFAYIAALLAEPGDRKSCWQLGEIAGHRTPRRMQAAPPEHRPAMAEPGDHLAWLRRPDSQARPR
jgi:hypothetical protein